MAGDKGVTASYHELAGLAAEGGTLPSWVEATIANDVPRTLLEGQPAPGPEDQEALARLLRALACWDPELAYCQGMNYVVRFAFLSSDMPHSVDEDVDKDGTADIAGCVSENAGPAGGTEAEAFWLVACLLGRYGARGLFLERTPLLKLYSFCLSRLLEQRLPEVHSSLDGLDAVLGFKWFGTLFTTLLPYEMAAQAWGLIFRDGLTALLCLALGLCSLLAPALHAAQQEGQDATEFIGQLQRQLPRGAGTLLPPDGNEGGGAPHRHRRAAARVAGRQLLRAAEAQPCSAADLEPLLQAWRHERPGDAADLGEAFTFTSTAAPPAVVSKL